MNVIENSVRLTHDVQHLPDGTARNACFRSQRQRFARPDLLPALKETGKPRFVEAGQPFFATTDDAVDV